MTSSVLPSAEAPGFVPPRFATPRDPTRKTYGAAVARVAELLGTPLMPWQRYVADVAGEVDDRGMFVHRFVVVTVPRQSGKTTLDLAQSVQRCLMAPNRKVWHTAQTGQAARKKFLEMAEALMETPLRESVKGRIRKSQGSEGLVFVNGSQLRPHPPTRESLHGEQSDCCNIDEAWSFDELQGDDLLQAIIPTQATRFKPPWSGAQTFIWSTAGDRNSVWFRSLVNRGRSGDPSVCYFEWSIPDDADPLDPAQLAAHHPAVGWTQTMESIEAMAGALADKPGEVARALGNKWTGAGERVIPLDAWNAAKPDVDPATGEEATLPPGIPAFGIATTADGAHSAVVAAVADPDGQPWVEVLAHRPGRSWLHDYVLRLHDRHKGPVAVERRGPAAGVADRLELAGVELVADGRPDYGAACQDLYDRITETTGPRVRIRTHEALDTAADIAARAVLHDGGWRWARTRSAGDISALEAATLAAHAVARQPAPAPPPLVYFG